MATWKKWVLGAVVLIFVIGAIAGDPNEGKDDSDARSSATPQRQPTKEREDDRGAGAGREVARVQAMAAARTAVDNDEYAEALSIAGSLESQDIDRIRRRIANRVARRAHHALRTEDPAAARQLLRQADRYPATAGLRHARAEYEKARARIVQRRRDEAARRAARLAQRKREQAARERAAREAEREQADDAQQNSSCDSNYTGGCVPPYPPDVDCGDLAGPVQSVGSDPHGLDRDRDGIGCE